VIGPANSHALRLDVAIEKLRLAVPIRISNRLFEEQEAIVVTLSDGKHVGRGEASGVYYFGDTAQSVRAAIEAVRPAIERGIDRPALQQLLVPGGARNAVDCALWDLDAQRTNTPVWRLAGLSQPQALTTTFTLGADEPAAMAAAARRFAQARALKLKLTGNLAQDAARVRAVREARPGVWMGVDANQGYRIEQLAALLGCLVEAEVSLLEQPLERGCESDLDGLDSPIPIAADESVQQLTDLPSLVGRFQVINIKLDKSGGLTEALSMVREARALGLRTMVGCMACSSLAVAPAFLLAQLCDVVDLDAPLFLANDHKGGVSYHDGHVWSDGAIWGSPEGFVLP
jgi:L-alanine-DL-glutamate epimerase-like enolase superfamily enzyme